MIFSAAGTELVADFWKPGNKMPKIRKEREMNVEFFSSSKAAGEQFLKGACLIKLGQHGQAVAKALKAASPKKGTALIIDDGEQAAVVFPGIFGEKLKQFYKLLEEITGSGLAMDKDVLRRCPKPAEGKFLIGLPYGNRCGIMSLVASGKKPGLDSIEFRIQPLQPDPDSWGWLSNGEEVCASSPEAAAKAVFGKEAGEGVVRYCRALALQQLAELWPAEFQNRHNNGWHQLLRRVPDTPDLRRTRPETETIENQKYLVFEGIVGRGFSSHYTRLEVLVPEKGPTLFRAERFQLLIDKWAKGEKSEILTSLEEVVEFAYRLKPELFGPVQEGARRFLYAFSAAAEKQADWRRRPKNSARDFINRADGLKANIGEILAEKQANGH